MGKTLYEKVFRRHVVQYFASGEVQLFMGLHLLHEVTSPPAFAALKERGLSVLFPRRTFATADHIVPTGGERRPLPDAAAERMIRTLEDNAAEAGIRMFSPARGEHGIVHVIGPEQGLIQPGMTIACGDSHTTTHGAFGTLAFGIGTSQIRDVLASQTLITPKLKVRRIEINGHLASGVSAKDLILHIIGTLGIKSGIGFAYEFAGEIIERFSMEERMTICNMAIEAGARCGYINPDEVTYAYLQGRPFAPPAHAWDRAVAYWESIRSDPDAAYDDRVVFQADAIQPTVTWGITPGQSVSIAGYVPDEYALPEDERPLAAEARSYMRLQPGQPVKGIRIDVAFIGSCTNGRLSDLEKVAQALASTGQKVQPWVRAIAVPGSQSILAELRRRGHDRAFLDAGFELREPGCSMCVGLNADKLGDGQVCASSSNRNFKGRQGSPTGRTLIMSPLMVAAAAVTGAVADVREVFPEAVCREAL